MNSTRLWVFSSALTVVALERDLLSDETLVRTSCLYFFVVCLFVYLGRFLSTRSLPSYWMCGGTAATVAPAPSPPRLLAL